METITHKPYGPDGPEIEPTLLLRFLIQRYDDLLESDHPRIPFILGGLSLSGVAHDEESEAELRRILYPTTHPDHALLNRCKDIFIRTLARTKEEPTPRLSGDDGRLPSLDERASRQVLISALREGKRVIAAEKYEFAQIIRSLGWMALQCYPRRLAEFEDAWREKDLATATQRAVEVLRTAFRQRDRKLSISSSRNN
jgi:hypothetical protein